MEIKHEPCDSRMSRFLHPEDRFPVYLDGALTPSVTLTGEEVIRMIGLHLVQAKLVLDLAEQTKPASLRDLYPPRRLRAVHRRLKIPPTSPHA